MIQSRELDFNATMAIAAAIVRQAVDDYATVYMGGRIGENPAKSMRDLDRFFHSELYAAIMDIPGDELMRMVRIRELEKCVDALRLLVDGDAATEIHYRVQMPRTRQRNPSAKGRLRADLEYRVKAALEIDLGGLEARLLSERTKTSQTNCRAQTLTETPPRPRWKSAQEIEAAMAPVRLLATRPTATRYTVRTNQKIRHSHNPYRWVLPPILHQTITTVMEDELTALRVEKKIMQRQEDGDDPRDDAR